MTQVEKLESLLGVKYGTNSDNAKETKPWHKIVGLVELLEFSLRSGGKLSDDTLSEFKKSLDSLQELLRFLRKKNLGVRVCEDRHNNNFLFKEGVVMLGYHVAPQGIAGLRKNFLKYSRLARDYKVRLAKHPLNRPA
jgi:hypothetical protein